MNRNVKYVAIVIAAVIVIYLGYDLFKPSLYPCESIFQQTATQIGGSMETIEAKGALFIGRRQIQELTERSQMLALNLKTCCILSDQAILTSDQFLECKGSAKKYQKQIATIARLVNEAEEAKKQGKAEVVAKKVEKINSNIKQSKSYFEVVNKQISGTTAIEASSQQNNSVDSNKNNSSANTGVSEPNNTILEAQPVALGTTITAEISESNDVDYYRFTYEGELRDLIEIQLTNLSTTLSPEIHVYDEDKSEMFNRYDYTEGANLGTQFIIYPGNTYYIAFESLSSSDGAYKLVISNPLKVYDQYEANDDIFNVTDIAFGETITANILDNTDVDWYRLESVAVNKIRMTLENRSTTLQPYIIVYDENKSEVANFYDYTAGANLNTVLEVAPGETYYFALSDVSSGANISKYQFTVSAVNE